MSTGGLHALLIGIDRYSRDGKPAAGLYGDLAGAVLDVERWSRFLGQQKTIPVRGVTTLTAPLEGVPGSPLPTYERIVEALKRLGEGARPGDTVLFVFSGHGGCVPTLLPSIKGVEGLDEALIPIDVESEARGVLRDVELAAILEGWKSAGLEINLCFDCCHAGGATRRFGVRGTGIVDRSRRPAFSQVGSLEFLRAVWLSRKRRRRELNPPSGWLPNPQGYALFAACEAHEKAFEGCFDFLGPGGALTHALLSALMSAPSSVTCTQVHRQVVDEVQRITEGQTPQLEGDRDRPFFPCGKPVSTISRHSLDTSLELLSRGDPGHYLSGKLSLSLYGVPAGFDAEARDLAMLRRFVAIADPLDRPVVEGEWVCLLVTNRSAQPLFVTLYASDGGGERKKLYPAANLGEAALIRSGAFDLLPLKVSRPTTGSDTVEIIEALAANHSNLFRAGIGPGLFWTVDVLAVRHAPGTVSSPLADKKKSD